MNKRLLIPLALELDCISLLVYYGDMQLHPDDYLKFGWAAYFHTCQVVFLALFCICFALINKKSMFDNQFLMVGAFMNISLGVVYSLQGLGFKLHSFGLIIVVTAITIATGSIIFSEIRHELFKTE